jgi:RNA-directed DNA polymerase
LVKVDIRQFFESVSEIQAYRVFENMGYASLVSFELARLTTRVFTKSRRYRFPHWNAWLRPYLIRDYVSTDGQLGHLPQGAPTSPMLANLSMQPLDEALAAIGAASAMVYTRYSDDLAFSTAAKSFTRTDARALVREVYTTMMRFGLRPHTAKTVLAPPGARKVVLGLLVDRDRPRLSRAFKKRLEDHMRGVRKFGPDRHAASRNFRSILGLRRHLQGLAGYAAEVDADYGAKMTEAVNDLSWPL